MLCLKNRNLLREGVEDKEAEVAHYLQLFCIHLALTSPGLIIEQAEMLAHNLKTFIYPSAGRIEDIF